MTTHVFIVNDNTFKYHLEYMFAGTGAGEKIIDFNNSPTTKLYAGRKHGGEKTLVSMMADGCRVRKNDLVIFYLLAKKEKHEGMFFGIFQAVSDEIFLDNFDKNQFLYDKLKKSLTFRLQIRPYEVYRKGVTEWTALDEIKNTKAPYQMIWSLIYRKLKAERGNTMITMFEMEKLLNLIRNENNNEEINCKNKGLSYDENTCQITEINSTNSYRGRKEQINILPRFVQKYDKGKAHEPHLQMYITQNLGRGTNKSLDKFLDIENKKVEWLGNEVACGVGMQRIDVMFSLKASETKRIIYPIELKAVHASVDNTKQLKEY